MKGPDAGRRPLLVGLAGVGALGAAAAAARISTAIQGPSTDSAPPALTLSADSSSMSSLTVRLDDHLLTSRTGATRRTSDLSTSAHSMVAATWSGSAAPRVRIRSRAAGRWSGWRALPHLHDLPDRESGEGTTLAGTQLVWTGICDGIQVEVDGSRPADLELVLLHPQPLTTDRLDSSSKRSLLRSTARSTSGDIEVVPAPPLLSRADWGADESWRNGKPRYNATIQQAHVHHTASGNDYTRDDVPAILRGFYRYHTATLGWSDIAYNFLVDRFGRVWVGRAGGPTRPVRGAHTRGFNATSVGIAVIGNYQTATPSSAVLQSVAAVAAWKLHPYGRDPRGTTRVDSEGSDKFRSGRVVGLPVIDGHRDTNDTSCPGDHVYEKLAAIRLRAAKLIQLAEDPPDVIATTPSVLTGSPLLGQTLTVTPGLFEPDGVTTACTWLRDGVVVPGASGLTYLLTPDDLGSIITVRLTTAKAGYDSLVESLSTTGIAEATTAVVVRPHPGVRRARLHVRVHATDAAVTPTGTVTVILRRRTLRLRLVNGVAVARFTDLRPGRVTTRVQYLGTTGLLPSTGSAAMTIARRSRRKK